MEYVYTLHRSQGEYSDRSESPVVSYTTIEMAMLHKTKLEEHIAKLLVEYRERRDQPGIDHMVAREWMTTQLKNMELDPHCNGDDIQPLYFITTVPHVRHLDEFLDQRDSELEVNILV